jgi:hypothetical protein
MTDAQEAILDQLMGARNIGVQWMSGPLGLAVQALTSRVMGIRKDATRTLGYPMLLCQAVQAASATLRDVDERRKFAISFFSSVAPSRRMPRLTPQQHAEVALWCGRQVHPMVCREDCPYLIRVAEVVGESLANRKRHRLHTYIEEHCPGVSTRDWSNVAWTASPDHWAIVALSDALDTARAVGEGNWPGKGSNRAARDAARVAALAEGVEGALGFCLALAREVGL